MLNRLHKQQSEHGLAMERLYEYASISRQGYYQQLERKRNRKQLSIELISKVKAYRSDKDVRAGSRSLYNNLNIKAEYQIGINKFEHIIREGGMTMRPLRTRVVTTKSSYQSWQYSNKINGMELTNINQVVAGDLTYVDIGKDRFYAFTLTDLYSARVVGLEISTRMRSEEAFGCLIQWINLRGKNKVKDCIHHTDGGSQYFSKVYIGALDVYKVKISVANNCLENGYAEQQNSMIKNHFIPTINYYPNMDIQGELKRIKNFYNNDRKQEKLGWLSPVEYEKKWYTDDNRPLIKLYQFEK